MSACVVFGPLAFWGVVAMLFWRITANAAAVQISKVQWGSVSIWKPPLRQWFNTLTAKRLCQLPATASNRVGVLFRVRRPGVGTPLFRPPAL